MAYSVLMAKLQPPRTGAGLIPRPRLTSALSGMEGRKLTLVCAPAGYGKTVLLLQFASSVSRPVVWYQVDAFDNDLAVFIQYLVAGIRKHKPGFGAEALELAEKTQNPARDTRKIITSLAGELETLSDPGLLLVLDDYHEIADPVIHGFIEELLEFAPAGIHTAIGSRSRPPLRIAKLRLEGGVAEVTEDDLRLTSDEISGLLSAQVGHDVSLDAAHQVEQETLGWPAAARLAGISMRTKEPMKGAASPRGRKDIYEYLATEVFDALSNQEREFLESTSVLDVATPAQCNRLLGRRDSRAVLQSLASRNLFVSALDGREDAYRYHALFREFLQARLGDRRPELMEAACAMYIESGDLEKAVECYLSSGDLASAAKVAESVIPGLFRHGRSGTVKRWFRAIPAAHWDQRPWMVLFDGVLRMYEGRLEQAVKLFERSASAFEASGDVEGLAQAYIQKATVLRSRGRYRESIEMLDSAVERLAPSTLDIDASEGKAINLYLQGDFEASIRYLEDRMALAETMSDTYVHARILERLSSVYYLKGDYSKAVAIHQRAAEVLQGSPVENSIASVYCEWGDLDVGLETATRFLEGLEREGLVDLLPYGHHQVALALMYKGDLAAAEEHYRKAVSLTREEAGGRFMQALNLSFLARCLSLAGRDREALETAEEAIDVAEDQSPYVSGISTSSLGFALVKAGQVERGVELLDKSAGVFTSTGAKLPLCRALGVLSAVNARRGKRAKAVEQVRTCLTLAAAEKYIQVFVAFFDQYEAALELALEEGIEAGFVQDLMERAGARAFPALQTLSHNSDPAVRLRAVRPLSKLSTPSAVDLLKDLLRDPDEDVSEQALLALRTSRAVSGAPPRPAAAPGEAPTPPSAARKPETTASLRAVCLGPFRVTRPGGSSAEADKEIEWRTSKARDILAYLIDRGGGPVARERVLEDLWPESEEEQASTLFHTSLYQLRKALREASGREDAITYAGGHYRLAKGLIDTDKSRLETLLKDLATASPVQGPGGELGEAGILEEIVSLFQGEYLENLDYDWAVMERGRLDVVYSENAGRLARKYLDSGEYSRAAMRLRILLQKNPLLEEVHCLLMRAYAGMGDRLAVMQQYETLKDVLDRELGVDPSPESRSLYYQLCGERK